MLGYWVSFRRDSGGGCKQDMKYVIRHKVSKNFLCEDFSYTDNLDLAQLFEDFADAKPLASEEEEVVEISRNADMCISLKVI